MCHSALSSPEHTCTTPCGRAVKSTTSTSALIFPGSANSHRAVVPIRIAPTSPGHRTFCPDTVGVCPLSGFGGFAFHISAARSVRVPRRRAISTACSRVWAAIPTRRSARCANAAARRATSRVLPAPGGDGTTTAGSPDHTENSTRAVIGSDMICDPGHCVSDGALGLGAGALEGAGLGISGRGARMRMTVQPFTKGDVKQEFLGCGAGCRG